MSPNSYCVTTTKSIKYVKKNWSLTCTIIGLDALPSNNIISKSKKISLCAISKNYVSNIKGEETSWCGQQLSYVNLEFWPFKHLI